MELHKHIKKELAALSGDELVSRINLLRQTIHEFSPFKSEPVDCVTWVKSDSVKANDYNPNKVAPPEMELLEVSIMNDGYTQPIVAWPKDDHFEVVDGFHRSRVGKESKVVKARVNGYLPVVAIRKEQSGKNDRIASTIRHNRARGKHQVDVMSEIVIELKNRNWTNKRISKQLGMDEEEVLRLCQVSGLEHLFSDKDFSRAWESKDHSGEYEPLTDNLSEEEVNSTKPPSTGDNRVFHTYDKWECHKAGFYRSKKEGWTNEMCEQEYKKVLTDQSLFAEILERVTTEWKYSCEHYLTNASMNRLAWLGQAAACYHSGVPSSYSGAWSLLTKAEQEEANNTALKYLNKWLESQGMEPVADEEAQSVGRQIELY